VANPQPDKFTRISNELYDAIVQTDFSKRQRKIIDLVIRASYGCNKKFALLRPVDFEAVGVYKTHVKQELQYLAKTRVLYIDGERISLNKNYDEWRVSINKSADPEKLANILRRNLSGEVTETVTKVTKTVTEDEEDGYQNSNSEVTKTVTDTPPQSPEPSASEGCLKTIKDNSSCSSSCTGPQGPDSDKVLKFYAENFQPIPSPFQVDRVTAWLEDGADPGLVIFAMERALLAGKRRWSYVEGVLKNLWDAGARTREDAERLEEEFKRERSVVNAAGGRHSPRASPAAAAAGGRKGPGKYADLYE